MKTAEHPRSLFHFILPGKQTQRHTYYETTEHLRIYSILCGWAHKPKRHKNGCSHQSSKGSHKHEANTTARHKRLNCQRLRFSKLFQK